MSNSNSINTTGRLGFIDAGRSLAIILMLHGHFISMTFKDHKAYAQLAMENGTSGSVLFDIRYYTGGITAPLFFTITGLVFTYLLMREKETRFWEQKRVRKGIRRGISIILWGYVLQFNIRNLDNYLQGGSLDRLFGFHVLQCIGVSLLLLIMFHGIVRLVQKVPLFIVLSLVGVILFVLTPIMRDSVHFIPASAPRIIQNALHGPASFFPIFPWVGYVFIGGSLGALLIERPNIIYRKYSPLIHGLLCALILAGISFVTLNYSSTSDGYNTDYFSRAFAHIAIILVILVSLIYIERWGKIRIPFFIRMGTNTLSIYLIHAFILYGAVIGWGLKTYFNKNLSLAEANLGALLFVIGLGFITWGQVSLLKRVKDWRQTGRTKSSL